MKIDEHEPRAMVALVGQVYPDTIQCALNRNGLADYFWVGLSGAEEVERKQVSEIIGNFEHVEMQLVQQMQTQPQPKLTLLVEGIADPTANGIQTYLSAPNGTYFRKGKHFATPYARYEGWLLALENQGVRVWRTSSLEASAEALVRMRKQSESAPTSILNRYVKVRQYFTPNPYVETLMGIKGGHVGAEWAEALIDTFGTPYDVLRSPVELVAETMRASKSGRVQKLGEKRATTLLRAIGRNV